MMESVFPPEVEEENSEVILPNGPLVPQFIPRRQTEGRNKRRRLLQDIRASTIDQHQKHPRTSLECEHAYVKMRRGSVIVLDDSAEDSEGDDQSSGDGVSGLCGSEEAESRVLDLDVDEIRHSSSENTTENARAMWQQMTETQPTIGRFDEEKHKDENEVEQWQEHGEEREVIQISDDESMSSGSNGSSDDCYEVSVPSSPEMVSEPKGVIAYRQFRTLTPHCLFEPHVNPPRRILDQRFRSDGSEEFRVQWEPQDCLAFKTVSLPLLSVTRFIILSHADLIFRAMLLSSLLF